MMDQKEILAAASGMQQRAIEHPGTLDGVALLYLKTLEGGDSRVIAGMVGALSGKQLLEAASSMVTQVLAKALVERGAVATQKDAVEVLVGFLIHVLESWDEVEFGVEDSTEELRDSLAQSSDAAAAETKALLDRLQGKTGEA